MKLLLVEDDELFAVTLQKFLKKEYLITWAKDAEEAAYLGDTNVYDLFILDINLPGQSGIELCRFLRANGFKQPILFLTGRADVNDKVAAFNAGADDYLVKPFQTAELLARLRALLRRPIAQLYPAVLKVGDVVLDTVKKTVARQSIPLTLRPKEYALLEYLMKNRGIVVTRRMILDHLWDDSYTSMTNTVDVHIKYLRDAIDKPFEKKLIKTVHGLGYRIDADK